jgi:hypothetical protein
VLGKSKQGRIRLSILLRAANQEYPYSECVFRNEEEILLASPTAPVPRIAPEKQQWQRAASGANERGNWWCFEADRSN